MAYNPYFNNHTASLSTLPTEISEQIYAYLTPTILTRLARVSRAIYASVQSPLYRHATISSYEKLPLFIDTLHAAATFNRWGEGASKNVVSLRISIDPNAREETAGSRPTAVMLKKMISTIGRYCPSVRITLHIKNGSCNSQPISSFERDNSSDAFSNVTSLILHVGAVATNSGSGSSTSGPSASSLSQVIPSRRFSMQDFEGGGRGVCKPNRKFWAGIFNGRSFPDLKEVEIKHIREIARGSSWLNASPVSFEKGDLRGLDNITKLVVESTPELNDSVLMSALNFAQKLKILELRKVSSLSYEALSQLLPHALPNLTHFTLEIEANHSNSITARHQLESYQPLAPISRDNPAPPHLCPLFRQFAKDLQYLNLKAPYLCRDLFLDEIEKLKLDEAGVKVDIGGPAGGHFVSSQGEIQKVDAIAIQMIIKAFRAKKEEIRFKSAIHEKLKEKGTKKGDDAYEVAITGIEYEEEQKRFQRARKIKEQKWERKIRVSQGMCREGECWGEMGILASLEEEDVNWLLGKPKKLTNIDEALGLVTRCENGIFDSDQKYEDAFPGFVPSEALVAIRNRNYGHDFNDDMA